VTNPLPKFRFTFWKLVLIFFMVIGAYSTWIRFRYGLGASTNLTDQFPWGLWVGFDVLCGVMLAAGGFTLTAAVHIFNIKRLHAIVRPTVLTAFLGYVLVSVALMFDLGRPYRIWHPLIMRNPHSVMFEVAYCVMLYTTVLALEFAPIVLEHFNLKKPLVILSKISVPVVILGVLLSTLHQSSLGTVYLIMPNKLHPFWYSPILPAFFFLSAIAVGLAMTIFESSMSSKYFGRALELSILRELGRVLVVVLGVYSILRFEDLYHRGVLKLIFIPSYEQRLFLVEAFLILGPLALLCIPKVRNSAQGLYLAAVMVVLGFITNRLNVSITGIESAAGTHYIPKWTELAITGAIIAAGFAIFGLVAKYLPIFPEEHEPNAEMAVPADAPVAASAMAHAGD
jgi:Ni/Fe-hydrogenase subunit HybB-like protein